MNNLCDICKKVMNDVYVLQLSDDKGKKVSFRGHVSCVNELYNKVKEIDKTGKMSVQQVLNKLELE